MNPLLLSYIFFISLGLVRLVSLVLVKGWRRPVPSFSILVNPGNQNTPETRRKWMFTAFSQTIKILEY